MEEKTQEETIDISPENKEIDKISEIDTDYNNFKLPIIARDDTPTYNPKTFKEQFYIKDDSSLYVNNNGTWFSLGGGSFASGYGHATSGEDMVVTCGFTPKVIKMTTYNATSGSSRYSIGQWSSAGQHCIFLATSWTNLSGYIAYVMDSSGIQTNGGQISATSSTGFTISWVDYVSGVTDFLWEAYG